MALSYGNQYLGGSYVSMFGKTITTNTMYGKLGESEILVGADAVAGTSSSNIDNKELDSLYEKVGVYLEELMITYIDGKLDLLQNTLTLEKVEEIKNNISRTSSSLSNRNSLQKLINTYSNILSVLEDSTEQYKEYVETLEKLEIAQEKANILEDPVKLQEYINTYLGPQNTFLMELPEITTTPANIKPEIQQYIKLYGVPENLEFDQEKLDIIIQKIYG
jgi:hypothetical protein